MAVLLITGSEHPFCSHNRRSIRNNSCNKNTANVLHHAARTIINYHYSIVAESSRCALSSMSMKEIPQHVCVLSGKFTQRCYVCDDLVLISGLLTCAWSNHSWVARNCQSRLLTRRAAAGVVCYMYKKCSVSTETQNKQIQSSLSLPDAFLTNVRRRHHDYGW